MVKNTKLAVWLEEIKELCQPDDFIICDGSDDEYNRMWDILIKSGVARQLDHDKRPNSYLVRSDPKDVARVESRTFICSEDEADAGPNNNWIPPDEMRKTLKGLFKGCMHGRTMYVIPFSMGPVGSPIAHIGVEITDSPYVVASMHVMTRIGKAVLEELGRDGEFVPCVHSVGLPLDDLDKDVPWPCNPDNLYISHFPDSREIWSFGSGYGGNALLGKKCFALRIASAMAHDEGWLAEHMLILKLTNPEGAVHYIAGAFPSACGKTNLAMLIPTIPDWKVEMVGDDICWMKFQQDGRLFAINPEAGIFGVAPGTGMASNANAMLSLHRDCIFTNVAETDDGDIWWEGMTEEPPDHLIDWNGNDWTPESGTLAAHPNARFTVSAAQCPVIADEWEDLAGVPISAILFGGRRATVVPLVNEAANWIQGAFFGSIISSEKTAAASGTIGELRRDPMAMLPFCGYNMADYWQHWVDISKMQHVQLPRIYYVNWFRKDADGKYIWPGFGENSRVLKWIFERCEGSADAVETPIGNLPTMDSLDLSGINLGQDEIAQLLSVEIDGWLSEIPLIEAYYTQYGDRVPQALRQELNSLRERLENAIPADG
ncbi:MAG: phosphoenolpyruvate carboxykinase (GTP) [Gammaproteobacteria bacterium]|nr:phosphoenolpyruvate carboxykinase (GTP) [Gammaproteobacteria bacterium]